MDDLLCLGLILMFFPCTRCYLLGTVVQGQLLEVEALMLERLGRYREAIGRLVKVRRDSGSDSAIESFLPPHPKGWGSPLPLANHVPAHSSFMPPPWLLDLPPHRGWETCPWLSPYATASTQPR